MNARDNTELKSRLKEIEQNHLKERKDTQREYELFKQATNEKEAHLEREYREKAMDMKDNLQEIKRKFDLRCEDYKK